MVAPSMVFWYPVWICEWICESFDAINRSSMARNNSLARIGSLANNSPNDATSKTVLSIVTPIACFLCWHVCIVQAGGRTMSYHDASGYATFRFYLIVRILFTNATANYFMDWTTSKLPFPFFVWYIMGAVIMILLRTVPNHQLNHILFGFQLVMWITTRMVDFWCTGDVLFGVTERLDTHGPVIIFQNFMMFVFLSAVADMLLERTFLQALVSAFRITGPYLLVMVKVREGYPLIVSSSITTIMMAVLSSRTQAMFRTKRRKAARQDQSTRQDAEEVANWAIGRSGVDSTERLMTKLDSQPPEKKGDACSGAAQHSYTATFASGVVVAGVGWALVSIMVVKDVQTMHNVSL